MQTLGALWAQTWEVQHAGRCLQAEQAQQQALPLQVLLLPLCVLLPES